MLNFVAGPALQPVMATIRALALLCLGLLSLPAVAAPDRVRTPHVVATLLAERDAVGAGETLWVGLRFDLIPHWHLYWRNPGDSGEAPSLGWRLPPGWSAGDIRWPVPERLPAGAFVNYGYERSVTLMVPLHAGPAAPAGPLAIELDARWLVCRVECIPESGRLTLALRAGAGAPNPAVAAHFAKVRAQWPVALDVAARYRAADGRIELRVPGTGGSAIEDAWFAAHDWGPVAPGGRQTWTVQGGELRLAVPAGERPPDGRAPLAGLLVLTERSSGETLRRGYTVEARPDRATAGRGLAAALGLALLGGLILNLMPCVLPVLSVKVLGFVHAAHGARARVALHGLLFAAGVLVSVLLLAGVLLALRAGGAALGWGFQLQSPWVVTLLAYVMLLVGLNLSGVFHVGQGLMGLGGGAARGGAGGAFATGVLAAVVASPCTAPFMGAALGFALTRPAFEALAVFLALGAGFAAPVLALSLWPAWLRRLPRPGPWMGRLQQLLAFPMYGAAVWLVWVLSQQAGPQGLAAALAGGLLLAFAAWLYGQRRPGTRVASIAAAAALAGALALAAHSGRDPPGPGALADRAAAWSPERVAQLRIAGRPVLVNFTAAWCITCQVNERLALATPAVTRAMDAKGVAYLKADWTRHDPAITRELARHARSGVPLYLVYAPGTDAPQVLPALLTEALVLEALDRL